MKDQFMRIAMARLRGIYPFKPQRRAVAAKMWVRFVDKNLAKKSVCANHARWQEEEEELNKRMNIIGQNGNTGEHYEESH